MGATMPGVWDLAWYSVMLTFATLIAFIQYSLYLRTSKGKANTMKLVFLALSMVLLVATCLWLKDRNDVLWKIVVELGRTYIKH
jgi:heme/copper-type cytochrome/quinol oxidase subunit 4